MSSYESYRNTPESGWYTKLPLSWKSQKLRELFSERKTKVSDKEHLPLSVGKMGVVPQLERAVKTENGDNRKLICKDDFAINSRSDRKGSCGISKYDGSCSLIITVLKPHHSLNSRFYHHLLRSHFFSEEFYRNGFGIVSDLWTTKWATMRDIYIPVPPPDEQDQIVRFLDWKISSINRMIAIKRKEISCLDTLKNAMINHAVMRGIRKGVPLKDSGIKWLGQVPAHWFITNLRQLLHVVSEKKHPELPLLSVVRERGVIIRDIHDKDVNHNFVPDDLSGYKMVRKGQFAINKMKAWQGSYGVSPYTGIVSPAYFVFDVKFDNLSYFHHAIRSSVYVNFFAQASYGVRVGQWDLQMDKMKEIPFITPPKDEQDEIVSHIEKGLSRYDKAIDNLTEEVEKLHELKARLISDTVTGKIDVRGIDIPAYEPMTDEMLSEADEYADDGPDTEEV